MVGVNFGGDFGAGSSLFGSLGSLGGLSLFVGVVVLVAFTCMSCDGGLSMAIDVAVVAFVRGARASGETTMVGTCCTLFGVVGITVDGANDNFVCFGPPELISVAVVTRVCLDLIPPLGDSSLPLVLVALRFVLFFLVMVAHVASVR